MKTNFTAKIFCCLFLLMAVCFSANATYITVAKDGTGQYNTVQAAIDNAPVATSAATADTIFIKDGRYREKISVPANKPYIVMIGQSVANTILTFDDGATTVVNGAPLGTQNSASFSISATDFTAINITFVNAFGDGTQGVAVLVNNDRAIFKNCRFLGNQDTLYIKGAGTPKHYFSKCYIDGNVDFIFGSSIAVFDTCVIYGKIKPSITSTYIVAPNTTTGQAYGIVFRGCQLTGNTSAGYYYLGRPWNANPKAVFLDSRIYNNMIIPAGWSSSSAGSATLNDSYFAEHKSRLGDGTLVDTMQRVATSFQLSDAASATYTLANMFGTWDPCSMVGCGSFTPPIAMANMKATKGASTSTITWNISWPIAGVQYQLYRSTDSIVYNPVSGAVTTALNDTTWNFQFTDTNPAQGSVYWYYVKATKAGYATHNSDTVKISSAPTIVASSNLVPFSQFLGIPSLAQSYTVSGTNLTANLAITAPSNYELSTNASTYTGTLSLAPASGTVAPTTVYVRLNASALGAASGNIVHTSTGAATVNVPVSGTTSPAPTVSNDTLEFWPLLVSNADSAAFRATGIVPTTPTLNRLYLSTATAVSTVPAYSSVYGQAFGASATSDGAWGTAVGGPGGNLSRAYYEEFTVKAASGDSIRVDSLLLTSAFYLTSSNTRLAVAYSRSGFASDSTEVPGATFSNPITLANQSGGPTNVYRLALSGGPAGIKTDTAGTLSIRLYFSCSSSSNGRYGMLKNVVVIGEVLPYTAPCNVPALSTSITHKTCTANGSINLTTTGGSAPFSYAWTGPGTFSATTKNLTNLDTGTYNVVVTATGGCTATATARVTRTAFTTTATAIGTTTFCQGDTVVLKAAAGAGYTYTWKNGSTTITGAADSMYRATAGGSYTVVVAYGSCTATSNAIAVTVHTRPSVTVTASGPLTFCAGDSVMLTVAGGNTYQWKNGANVIPNATDSVFTARAGGDYTVSVVASTGCKDSSVASTVAAIPLPVPVIIYAAGQLSTGTYTSYQWNLNGSPVSGATSQTFVPQVNGTYTVTVDSGGCRSTSSGMPVSGLSASHLLLNGKPIVIYPNPAAHTVFIDAAAAVNVQIKDMLGQVVCTYQNAAKMDVSKISNGIYMLMVYDLKGQVLANQRFIKIN